jgi:hypothetical protein
VAQIDTASFTVDVTPLSGTFSEGACIYGQSLYVCNSGQGAGNAISVVSVAQFVETATITVPYNPVNIVNAGNGELYFNTASVWSGPATGAPANLHALNAATRQLVKTFNFEAESVAADRNYVYTAATDWGDYGSIVKKVSIADKSASDFSGSADSFMFGYKVSLNPVTGELFLTQQMGQDIGRFKADGTLVETLKTGQQNGSAVVFMNVAK